MAEAVTVRSDLGPEAPGKARSVVVAAWVSSISGYTTHATAPACSASWARSPVPFEISALEQVDCPEQLLRRVSYCRNTQRVVGADQTTSTPPFGEPAGRRKLVLAKPAQRRGGKEYVIGS
ncbi:Uu.00g130190.m01.CDS01 [Anthostomella pinea]|uniref:Uu.00g130190.m01.CDS01 n=1 Tax=Anthostomella pinea TaxID=933095 RepID=A0AAI8YI19_9PEZI|nr:Uu.00g130190.m01.CDS01 [Anthostomella pinea]